MNNEKVRAVIVELFDESGVFGHYRAQYSAAVIDEFVGEKSVALAKAIVLRVGEKFQEHAASSAKEVAIQGGTPGEPTGQALPEPVVAEQVLPADDPGSVAQQPSAADVSISGEQEPASVTSEPIGGVAPATSATTAAASPTGGQGASQSPHATGGSPQKQMPAVAGRGDPVPRKFSFRLKGGKLQSGVPYDGRIESVDGAAGAIAHVLSVQIPPEIGLQSEEGDPSHIIGTPTLSGDVSIGLNYRVEAPGADEKALSSSIAVFINHDPKSLWKDLPSDKADPYWKPDVDSTFQQVGVRKMIAASKRGRSHAHEGKFRDDDFRIAHSAESDWTVIAVADGAGGSAKSRRGSKIAVDRAVDILFERLAAEDGVRLESLVASWHRGEAAKELVISSGLYPILGIAAFEACKAIEAEASAAGVAAKEYSTTLLVTAYKKLEIGHLFATYWVGDGGVGIYQNDGTPKLLGKVDSGEFAGQTRFLDHKVMTTEEIAARLNFALVDDFKALVAMTDGITDPYFMTDNNLESGEYWGKLWAELDPALNADNPQGALLAWLDFWSAGNHDDRTIAVLW